MDGVRGGYSLKAGSSWARFEEDARDYESSMGWAGSRNPLSPTTGRLCREDMAIYGEEPAMDSLSLVVCRQCGRVVKSQALLKHKELYHREFLRIPAPKRAHRLHLSHFPSPSPSPIHTVGQASGAVSTEDRTGSGGGVRGGANTKEVTGFTATGLPRETSSSIAKGSKEFDPDRHCGVWLEEEQKPCMRSLTCKFHLLSQRQKVLGRSRPFNELLEVYRKRKNMKKKRDKERHNSETESSAPLLSPMQSPLLIGAHFPLGDSPPSIIPPSFMVPQVPCSDGEGGDCDLSLDTTFPLPLTACSFSSRHTSRGSLVFNRRQDSLRSALTSLSGRSRDYTETTIHRKHSYQSLLKQKAIQRKYFGKQNHILLERTRVSATPSTYSQHLPNLTLPPPPSTTNAPIPPSPLLPPPPSSLNYPPPVSDSTPTEPRSFPTSQFYHSSSTPTLPSESPIPSRRDSTSVSVINSELQPQPLARNEKPPKKGKSKRGRKPKHQREKRGEVAKDRNETRDHDRGAGHVQQGSGAVSHTSNDISSLPLFLETSQARLSGLDVRLRSPVVTVASAMSHEDSQNALKVVCIKQEPITNHEEMDTQPPSEGTSNLHLYQTPPPLKGPPKPHSLVLNGMVPPSSSLSVSLTPSIHNFNSLTPSQTFVLNPSSVGMMTSLTPHVGGILPIGALGMPANASLSPSRQHQRSQLIQPQTHHQQMQAQHAFPLQATSGVHLPMQSLPDQLQRQFATQQNIWLASSGVSSTANSLPEGGGFGRPILLPQHQQQGGQVFPGLKTNLGSPYVTQAGLKSQNPMLSGRFQIAASASPFAVHRTAPSAGNKVRAPISQISPGSLLQDSLPLPPSRTQNQSPLQNKQNLAPRSRLSSQQVT